MNKSLWSLALDSNPQSPAFSDLLFALNISLEDLKIQSLKDGYQYYTLDPYSFCFLHQSLDSIHVKNAKNLSSSISFPHSITRMMTIKDTIVKFAPLEPEKGKVGKHIWIKYPEKGFMLEFASNHWDEPDVVWNELTLFPVDAAE